MNTRPVPQIDVGWGAQQSGASGRHLDHDRTVEMSSLGRRSVPFLDHHPSPGLSDGRAEIDITAAIFHSSEDDVLGEHRREGPDVVRIEPHRDHYHIRHHIRHRIRFVARTNPTSTNPTSTNPTSTNRVLTELGHERIVRNQPHPPLTLKVIQSPGQSPNVMPTMRALTGVVDCLG